MKKEETKTAEEIKNAKHKRIKTIFKITGIMLVVAGLALIIAGFVSFASAISRSEFPDKFWLLIIGFPLTAFGTMLTLMGFRKELMSYGMRESTGVFNEASQKMQPGIHAIADAILNTDGVTCPSCGALNDKDSAFCKKCGASLGRKCPHCGADLDSDALFCDKCGKKI